MQRELWNTGALDMQYVGFAHHATWIGASSSTRRRPVPGAIDARRPNQNFGVIRIIQNDLYANYDAFSVHPATAHEPWAAG